MKKIKFENNNKKEIKLKQQIDFCLQDKLWWNYNY